jgi:muconolactone delta-isomerase
MKFLVETEFLPNAPVERLPELIERTKGQVARQDTPVVVECVYGVLGRRGAVAICEAPDAESLQKLLVSAPLFHFETMKVTPLVDFGTTIDALRDSAAAL